MTQPEAAAPDRRHPFAVDLHAHTATPGVLAGLERGNWHGVELLRRDDGKLVSKTKSSTQPLPWADFTQGLDSRLERLDQWALDMQVLSLTPTLWRYEVDAEDGVNAAREVNDDLIGMVAEHPDRFRIFAHLPLQDARAAADELERAMGASEHVVGAAVSTHVNGRDWDDPELDPILERAEALNAVMLIHPSSVRFNSLLPRYHLRNMIGNPAETTLAIASLIFGGVLDRHPDLRFVFVHGGGYAVTAAGRFDHGQRVRPEAKEPQRRPTEYMRQLYFDSLTHSEAGLRHLVEDVGVSQVVLGSDDPADMGREDPARWVWGCDSIDEATRTAILGENAARLLGLREPVGA